MNSCKEFEGKNVDQAVELACQTLNITKNQLKYDILSNGSSGIFSIIRNKKAKIRVNLENSTRNKQRVLNLVDEAFGVKKNQVENTRKPRLEKTDKPIASPEIAELSAEAKPATKSERTDRPKPKPAPKPVPALYDDEEEGPDDEPRERIISDFYKGKSADVIGREVLETVLPYITDGFEVRVESSGENLVYHISSEDSAVIIGKRGQNLEAMQYIVDKIVNKHSLERKRVLIDVEGYLEKRRENLEKMAIRMSDKVTKTGKPSTISQMSAQDRRIVHLALKDNKSVRTQSMGEGYYRRLVIFPKKGKARKKKD
ncbi:hypothetical protein JCM14469_25680 [Desulfatiferula olefinivorans]